MNDNMSGFEKKNEETDFLQNQNTTSNNQFVNQQQNLNVKMSDFTELIKIGEGAMSIVYRGKNKDGKIVAIKRIKPEYKDDVTYFDLFNKEFDNAKSLHNDNIVKVYEKGQDSFGSYYTMEYIDGLTLRKYITEVGITDGNLIKKIALEILNALSSLHKNSIYHRDLKPDNILITKKGHFVKIIDFGVSKSDYFVDNIMSVGTKKYAAPEQLSKISQDIDGRSDIYTFGLILLEMLTGYAEKTHIKIVL